MSEPSHALVNENDLIIAALRVACDAHAQQWDTAGAPYILHPLRVGLGGETTDEIVAGILHDVVEDSHFSLDDLRRMGFPERIIDIVNVLTRDPDGDYDAYIDRILPHPAAAVIKLRDLEHNLDARRFGAFTEKDAARFARYLRAWKKIREHLAKQDSGKKRRPTGSVNEGA